MQAIDRTKQKNETSKQIDALEHWLDSRLYLDTNVQSNLIVLLSRSRGSVPTPARHDPQKVSTKNHNVSITLYDINWLGQVLIELLLAQYNKSRTWSIKRKKDFHISWYYVLATVGHTTRKGTKKGLERDHIPFLWLKVMKWKRDLGYTVR